MLIFRSETWDQFIYFLTHAGPAFSEHTLSLGYRILWLGLPVIAIEVWMYAARDTLAPSKARGWLRVPVYSLLLLWIFLFGVRQSLEYYYFQF